MKLISTDKWIIAGFTPECHDEKLLRERLESVNDEDKAILVLDGKEVHKCCLRHIRELYYKILPVMLIKGGLKVPSPKQLGIFLVDKEIAIVPNIPAFREVMKDEINDSDFKVASILASKPINNSNISLN